MGLVTPLESSAPPRGDAPQGARRLLRLSAWSRADIAVATSAAAHHRVNEDAHSDLARESRVLVLADGVGGGAMAAEVSRRLVDALHQRLDRGALDAGTIARAVLDADRELRDFVGAHTREPGAATLALCAAAGRSAREWWIAWVGDCRIYAAGTGRDEPARQLTHDDSYLNLGEAPPPGGSPADPARMVGNGAVREPNVRRVRLARGERLLLCSDGVHKHLTPHQIGELLRPRRPLEARCCELVERARAAGSTDDATALVLERHRMSWIAWGAWGLAAAVLLLLAGLALWNAYGLGGRATPPVFDPDPTEGAVPGTVAPPPLAAPASAASAPVGGAR
ncbi:PP2C family protein-serine/threonine phosphatase [Caldimonas tepidiphila]|uniref:PP2C family protein-serine/threonine phosphatase n=1 Tax=Caldimonas tepidiphila TaxID=2315841 RepID=UPI000E5B832F|nr:protein phosphatase 2C domain-containing protein [Caldimonas tepidiphila]